MFCKDKHEYKKMSIPMEETKKLGFGLMRLPRKGLRTDVEQTKKMVDIFMESGFT